MTVLGRAVRSSALVLALGLVTLPSTGCAAIAEAALDSALGLDDDDDCDSTTTVYVYQSDCHEQRRHHDCAPPAPPPPPRVVVVQPTRCLKN